MSPRRPFSPYGRIVGTFEEVAADLGIPIGEVLRAIAESRLQEWGRNGAGAPVYRVRDLERALGWPEPERPRRGDRRFTFTIPGSHSRRRSVGGLQSGRDRPASIEEV